MAVDFFSLATALAFLLTPEVLSLWTHTLTHTSVLVIWSVSVSIPLYKRSENQLTPSDISEYHQINGLLLLLLRVCETSSICIGCQVEHTHEHKHTHRCTTRHWEDGRGSSWHSGLNGGHCMVNVCASLAFIGICIQCSCVCVCICVRERWIWLDKWRKGLSVPSRGEATHPIMRPVTQCRVRPQHRWYLFTPWGLSRMRVGFLSLLHDEIRLETREYNYC